MKFTAVVPIMKMETRTYDVNISENTKKVIKAYEKWYDDMSKENEASLIDAIKANDPSFDERIDDFEEYANNVVDDIRWKIYREEVNNGNEAVYDFDDIFALADGNFNF
jgi:hypothetical protein